MSTYSLSGTGVQGLSANVTALHVTITTLPAGLTSGRANPTNHFDIGLLRFGDGTAYSAPTAILGGPQWIGVPVGTTVLGYALLNGAVISVVEVRGGPGPLPPVKTVNVPSAMPLILSPLSKESIGVELAAMGAALTGSATWATPNLSMLVPLIITDTISLTTAWVHNGTSVAGHWDVGVYDLTFNLLEHSGSQTQLGTSTVQVADLILTLSPGTYWLAMAVDSGSTTSAFMNPGGAPRNRLLGIRQATSNFPLATTPSISIPTFGSIAVFGVSTYSP